MEKPIQAYISEALYRRLKQRVAAKQTTIKAVVVRLIEQYLAEKSR